MPLWLGNPPGLSIDPNSSSYWGLSICASNSFSARHVVQDTGSYIRNG